MVDVEFLKQRNQHIHVEQELRFRQADLQRFA
jgi:hypothetical protein